MWIKKLSVCVFSLLLQNGLKPLHFVPEVPVDGNAPAGLFAAVKHSGMVAPADTPAYLGIRHIGIFMTKIHGELARLHHVLLTAFGENILLFHPVMLTYGREDTVGRKFAFFQIDSAGHNAGCECQVYVAIVYNGVSHDAVDDTFKFAHAAFHVLCDVLHHLTGKTQPVAADFRLQYGLTQFGVGFFHLSYHAPLEAREHALLNAFEKHRRTVAGNYQLAAVLLQVIEYMEKACCVLAVVISCMSSMMRTSMD